ncbi:hypothetical protein [Anaerosolibacter carboniphilus]
MLLLVNVILVLLGMIMDMALLILITTLILLPVVMKVGMGALPNLLMRK